ncbi:hypothetical protein K1T71_000875 [Dendrolimus kikuchii]|uniref:Uncharacterized protein n=1 Tax=Dendrolimus kikuchii TaxID=765133 RepID=A0ACC1DFZ5_9NEOP|nr:hypothetical protein K1T71_000875 [Dendrolimus kikuchii]
MPYYCTVPRCTSMAGKIKNVSFHQFPRDEELAKLWNEILKRGKPYTKYSKVCSLHFKPEDYTITSVGKNKGQWRTLRKDAIPSQNLPSDAPVATQRRQSEPWLSNASPILNMMDPMIHQQVAQAIYMQTMLAMQAVGANTPSTDTESDEPPNSSSSPNPEQTYEHTNSYKCNHCTKCFKDPDVFLLHQRNHTQKALETFEKENFNINTTLMTYGWFLYLNINSLAIPSVKFCHFYTELIPNFI